MHWIFNFNYMEKTEIRKCINCGKEFSVNINKNRNTSRQQLFCCDCISSLTNWERKTIKMKKFPEARNLYLQQKRDEFLRNYIKQILLRTKKRAESKNIDFNLDESDIIIPKVCPILEVPLIIGTKGNYEYSPSIDRIDNTKGYIKGNVQIISKKANSMKNSASQEELIKFCKNILRYSLTTTEKECSELKDKEPSR